MSTAPAPLFSDRDELVVSSPRDPRAAPLLEALVGEYTTRYRDLLGREPRAAEEEVYHRYAPSVFEPPHGAFLLVLRDGVAIAGGGFMVHEDDGTAELKRIWTAATHRRQGLARRVCEALEVEAARLGYTRIFLTTGFRQPEAAALYRGMGYTPLFDPDADPAVLFKLPFDKILPARGA